MTYKEDLTKTNRELRRKIRVGNFSRMRDAVRFGKSESPYKKLSDDDKKLPYKRIAIALDKGLAKSDYLAKKHDYGTALNTLINVTEDTKNLPENIRERYLDAIENRATRIAYHNRGRLNYDVAASVIEKVDMTRGKSKGLERTALGIVAIVGVFSGLFFLSSTITGNVIGSLNTSTSNIIGAVLILVGLVGAFLYFRRK